MKILKALLANTFGKTIRLLENRNIKQMKDLLFNKDCFAKEGKMIDKLETIKIRKTKKKK